MQIDEYLLRYEQFHIKNDIDTSVKAKNSKLVEELCEYLEAHASGDKAAADDECLDLVNVAISLAVSRGIHNVLFFAALKLEKTTEKYAEERAKNNALKGQNVCSQSVTYA